jgi:hypothetical protein
LQSSGSFVRIGDMELAEYIATDEAPEPQPGWSDLGGQARKYHYFPDMVAGTRALCGKWAIARSHSLQPETGQPSPDDCKACTRKLRG